MKIIIPEHRGISWNKFYDSPHWTRRAELARNTHLLMRMHMPEQYDMFTEPVNVRVQAHYKHHPTDSDNVCAKIYIDGLKGLVIEDDDPKFLHDVSTRSINGCCEDYVEITIEEAHRG